MNNIQAGTPLSNDTLTRLMDAMVDITGAATVEVLDAIGADGKPVLWVNVNGVCVLRACRIEHFTRTNVNNVVDTARAALRAAIRGTHDSCPTRYLPLTEESGKIDDWWMDYFTSAMKSNFDIAKRVDAILAPLSTPK